MILLPKQNLSLSPVRARRCCNQRPRVQAQRARSGSAGLGRRGEEEEREKSHPPHELEIVSESPARHSTPIGGKPVEHLFSLER